MTKRKTPTTSTLTRATTSAPKRVTANAALDQQAVARRAYEKFLERGGQHGSDVEDWLAAEAELRAL
ncbi:MAG: DUF2934 domain-containing protein [Kofleriaceae bacterium]